MFSQKKLFVFDDGLVVVMMTGEATLTRVPQEPAATCAEDILVHTMHKPVLRKLVLKGGPWMIRDGGGGGRWMKKRVKGHGPRATIHWHPFCHLHIMDRQQQQRHGWAEEPAASFHSLPSIAHCHPHSPPNVAAARLLKFIIGKCHCFENSYKIICQN